MPLEDSTDLQQPRLQAVGYVKQCDTSARFGGSNRVMSSHSVHSVPDHRFVHVRLALCGTDSPPSRAVSLCAAWELPLRGPQCYFHRHTQYALAQCVILSCIGLTRSYLATDVVTQASNRGASAPSLLPAEPSGTIRLKGRC
ncbi:hypothetical protein BD309DRAFT_995480 [Dichomitus squalens]|uniref:Uncharacterized protein n=1 Tax=Dichomitus squalens TaxID=114155 RepID=A0A4Q9N7S7_9APHY|nr:hypothetical protein BD311DRAFT_491500 [Dichomitus squalens]TBU36719.1 hypothetical protein BD309DRAFT_995480 [Dichomitus squalens]TBU53288.1 hypothetical protein BD310DRAFT_938309 [Dichomitus squalens]